jgi:hypothetical protein
LRPTDWVIEIQQTHPEMQAPTIRTSGSHPAPVFFGALILTPNALKSIVVPVASGCLTSG